MQIKTNEISYFNCLTSAYNFFSYTKGERKEVEVEPFHPLGSEYDGHKTLSVRLYL